MENRIKSRSISTGADGAIWSPDGKNIVFVSAVYPDCKDDACNKQRDEELKKSKVKAKIFSRDCSIGIGTRSRNSNAAICLWSADATWRQACACISRIATARLSGFGHHAGRSRCAAVLVRRSGHVCDFAGRPGGRLHEQHRRSRSHEHEQRNFRRADQRWHAKENFHQSRLRHHATLFAGRKILAWRSQARAGFEADKWRLFVQDTTIGKSRPTASWDRLGWQLCLAARFARIVFERRKLVVNHLFGSECFTTSSRWNSRRIVAR